MDSYIVLAGWGPGSQRVHLLQTLALSFFVMLTLIWMAWGIYDFLSAAKVKLKMV
jgi:hypothetical protein